MATDIGAMIMNPIQRFVQRQTHSFEEGVRNIPVVGTLYNQGKSTFQQTTGTGAYNPALPGQNMQNSSPMDPLINTAGNNADRAANKLNDLQRQLEAAGDNPPPGLLAKIQLATQAYQAWMTALKSAADAKGQVQSELARFR